MLGTPNFMPKSDRLNLPEALPPQRSLLLPAAGLHLKRSIVRLTRLGDAEQRQVAFDRRRVVAGEHDLRRLVGRSSGNSATLKKSAERRCSSRERARVPLSLSPVVDRRGLDRDVERARLRGAVERGLAGRLVEAAVDRRNAEMVDREVRITCGTGRSCTTPVPRRRRAAGTSSETAAMRLSTWDSSGMSVTTRSRAPRTTRRQWERSRLQARTAKGRTRA